MPDLDKRPTKKECIDHMCHQCLGYYADGKEDCRNTKCPLYVYMPYGKRQPDYQWREYNPKRVGLVTWEESKKGVELTDAQRAEMAERLRKAREANQDKKVSENTSEEDIDFDEEETDEDW